MVNSLKNYKWLSLKYGMSNMTEAFLLTSVLIKPLYLLDCIQLWTFQLVYMV